MESKLKCVFDLQYIEVNENADNNKDTSLGSLTGSLTNSNSNKTEDIGIGSNEQSLGSNVFVKVKYISCL